MNLIHNGYGINIDPSSLECIKIYGKLEDLYRRIPKTKCFQCPNKTCVEADCCKTFSPPMLLIEFTQIMRIVSEQTEDEKKNLYYKCFESFLDPGFIKPCPLLDKDYQCSVYASRPFSCRMFGLYDKNEWDERLKSVSLEIGKKKEDVPFNKQCDGVKVKKKQKIKTISRISSDWIFKQIHELDIELFPENVKRQATDIVMGSYTYLPFDAHHLLMSIGQQKLDDLSVIKIKSRQLKKKDQLLFLEHKEEVIKLLKIIKEGIL